MAIEITFILPTLNRKAYILRAVDSCLKCQTGEVRPHVLVIDGKSNDGSYELLLEKYGQNPQVEIIQMDRIGFQRTAYKGALHVKTEYVTYMYDDDLISPYLPDMIRKMIEAGRDFAMGYGAMYPIDKEYPFRPLEHFSEWSKEKLIRAYFGYPWSLPFVDMPVSPICCVVRTDFLKDWVRFSLEFAEKSEFRKYFMVDQNIGPDEIIYLANIINQEKTVLIALHVVGQFSSHDTSMSIQYGRQHLGVGYWIGKIWAFEKLCEAGQYRLAAQCAAYLWVEGLKLMIQMIFSARVQWLQPLCGELGSIFLKSVHGGFLIRTSLFFFVSVFNRTVKVLFGNRLPQPA